MGTCSSSGAAPSHLAPGHSLPGEPCALVPRQWRQAEKLLTGWHHTSPGLDGACRLWLQQETSQFEVNTETKTIWGGIRDPLRFEGKEGPPSILSICARCSKPSWGALQKHSAGSQTYAVKNREDFLTNLPVLTDPATRTANGTVNHKASISWEKVKTEKLLLIQPYGRGKTPIRSPQDGPRCL